MSSGKSPSCSGAAEPAGGAFDAPAFLATLTHRPGVYRMLDVEGAVLYVGKARDLKRRVSSYFGSRAHQPKTQALMTQTARVEVTVTGSEREALLLEYNLIKRHRPRFNVVLRDDKSYPYIYLSTEQTFPRFEFHRGSRRRPGRYFGPFPSASAVRQVLAQLQKLFRVRQCRDAFFDHRARPCLQYQIQRCTAPCVNLVTPADYARDVANAVNFLEGRSDAVLADLVDRMEAASARLDFEDAARYRDEIAAVREIQARQAIAGARSDDVDAVACHLESGQAGVAVVMVRGGRVLGSRSWFPRLAAGTASAEVLEAFLVQHYLDQPAPPEVLTSEAVEGAPVLEQVLAERAGHPVAVRHAVRGTRRRWLALATDNAREALAARRASRGGLREQLDALGAALGLGAPPERIECFDISHTGGEQTVAACVAFGPDGPLKSDYRRFNIRDATPGDDYAAIAEAVRRRYARTRRGEAPVPDLLLIDGGRGQVAAARAVLDELQFGGLALFGVAKGAGRRPGRERLFPADGSAALTLAADSPALHVIQQVRDEAHRFAVTGHRQRRARQRLRSPLEEIPGLGPKRRRALLQAFGGLQGVRRAGVEDLAAVRGISSRLAEQIFASLHDEG